MHSLGLVAVPLSWLHVRQTGQVLAQLGARDGIGHLVVVPVGVRHELGPLGDGDEPVAALGALFGGELLEQGQFEEHDEGGGLFGDSESHAALDTYVDVEAALGVRGDGEAGFPDGGEDLRRLGEAGAEFCGGEDRGGDFVAVGEAIAVVVGGHVEPFPLDEVVRVLDGAVGFPDRGGRVDDADVGEAVLGGGVLADGTGGGRAVDAAGGDGEVGDLLGDGQREVAELVGFEGEAGLFAGLKVEDEFEFPAEGDFLVGHFVEGEGGSGLVLVVLGWCKWCWECECEY